VLVRLLVPFSLSSPLSAPLPGWQFPLTPETHVALAEQAVGRTAEVTVTDTAAASGTAVAAYTPLFPALRAETLLGGVVLLGGAVTALLLLRQKKQYTKKLKNSLLVEHNETINGILREMQMGELLVFTNDEIASPLVCGTLRPRIYLPTRMDFENTGLLRDILTHEALHVKRKDNWVKAAMLVALCLNWYNPLVWWMSQMLCADLEAACDAAVLSRADTDQRQSYAYSLLSMALTGNRPTLLYSAFSKIVVERRIKGVLQYKKATALALILSALLLVGGTVIFATGGQAPFATELSSYCGTTGCKWMVKASLTRDIALGNNPQKRADDVIFDVQEADTSGDPALLATKLKAALAREFGVEPGAFRLEIDLYLTEEALAQEYAAQGITKGADGLYIYKGEPVRDYTDEMLSSVQTRAEGSVDIAVVRDALGNITGVTALHKGDAAFDRRSKEIARDKTTYATPYTGTAVEELTPGNKEL
ncbi:MAG: M56 family metallopeptidase, partial [Gemmiger sp.]|nr:M56 family metallopeptidase [Gemmiger sp.]